MMMRRILIATDFSEPARQALAVGASWARRFGAAVQLVHVYDPSPPLGAALLEPAAPPLEPSALEAHARARLEALQRQWLDRVEVTIEARAGASAAIGVAEAAGAARADLVVMGALGGRTPGQLGHVTEQVIRVAPCSVLSVRGRPAADLFPERLVVCTDFSFAADAAVRLSNEVARVFSAITLAHAYDPKRWRLYSERPAIGRQLGGLLASRYAQQFPESISRVVLRGSCAAELLAGYAAKAGADLLVCGAHGRTGPRPLAIGGTAEHLARLAPCSVLVARTAAPQLPTYVAGAVECCVV